MTESLTPRDVLAVKAAAFRWSTTRKSADARILAEAAGGLVMENERLRKVVAEYEEAITWETSCLNCSKATTASYAEYVRAETAEAASARVRALAQAAKRTECGAGWDLDPAAVLAALDQAKETP